MRAECWQQVVGYTWLHREFLSERQFNSTTDDSPALESAKVGVLQFARRKLIIISTFAISR
jgi:hypothetical protein